MMKQALLALALVLPAVSCGDAETQPPAANPETTNPGAGKAMTVAITPGKHEVRCGCKIDTVGKCGNYVDVDGDWLAISNPHDHGLGAMEWCSATETVEATVAGTRSEQTIELTQLDVLPK